MARCKLLLTFLLICIIFTAISLPTNADVGPKPSISVKLEGEPSFEGGAYLALLSFSSLPPPTVGDITEGGEAAEDGLDEYFIALAENLGVYYHSNYIQCKRDAEFSLNYPPSKFIIAIYHPLTDTLYQSEPTDRYAYDSYYTLTLNSLTMDGGSHTLNLIQKYRGKTEAFKLIFRIILTLAAELGIGYFLFKIRRPISLLIIGVLNTVTQLFLNLSLNNALLSSPYDRYTAFFIFLEIVIVIIEAGMLSLFLPLSENTVSKRSRYALFALAANIFSLAIGLLLSLIFPQIF